MPGPAWEAHVVLRIVATILVLLVALPGAQAAHPSASVKIAPAPDDGQAGDPYYLWANLTQPETPRAPKPADDCWKDAERPPPGPDGALLAILQDVSEWRPLEEFRLSGWFPECLAFQVASGDGGAHRVSYDVTTGRYVVSVDDLPGTTLPLGTGGSPFGFSMGAALERSGTTGLSIVTDCEECPPPV